MKNKESIIFFFINKYLKNNILDYTKEPDLHFEPISTKKYRLFYDLEMGNFSDDVNFYLSTILPHSEILELGCGSGRLTRRLAQHGHSVIGLDISLEMLQHAVGMRGENIHYTCMDMCSFSFSSSFDCIIIPYNTLNLLTNVNQVKQCLRLCRKHLVADGILLMQIYLPDQNITQTQNKTFQFQIMECPEGGKVIKETLKKYHHNTQTMLMEERYRIRPSEKGKTNEDLNHFMKLFTPGYNTWQTLLHTAGFSISREYGDYDMSSFSPDNCSCLLLEARGV